MICYLLSNSNFWLHFRKNEHGFTIFSHSAIICRLQQIDAWLQGFGKGGDEGLIQQIDIIESMT